MGVAVDHDNTISLAPLSRLGGGESQYSDWLLITLQWAELDAPPISVLWHTVVSSGEDERLYIRPVFDWCNPFVTGSLLFVAPVRSQAAAGSGRVVFIAGFGGGVALCSRLCCSGYFLDSTHLRDGDWELPAGRRPPEPGCPNPSTHSAGRRDSWLTGTVRLGPGVCSGCVGPACPTSGGAGGKGHVGA